MVQGIHRWCNLVSGPRQIWWTGRDLRVSNNTGFEMALFSLVVNGRECRKISIAGSLGETAEAVEILENLHLEMLR